MALPDTEFYLRCIRNCRAVAEGERGANERALLESHELIEVVLVVVPLRVSDAAPPPTRDTVSVALAHWLRAYALCDGAPAHPFHTTAWLEHDSEPVVTWIGPDQAGLSGDWARDPFPPAGHPHTLEALGTLLRGMVGGAQLQNPAHELRVLREACWTQLATLSWTQRSRSWRQRLAAAGPACPPRPSCALRA